jgi:hypothetical protein
MTVAVRIDITIKVNANPNLPFKGEKPTIAKVLIKVNTAPIISVTKSLGVNFHG